MSKGGRKIKRSKSLYGNRRKNKVKGIFAIILTIIIAGALLFLGYSVGEPIMNFFKNWGTVSSSDSQPWSPSDVESENNQSSGEKDKDKNKDNNSDNKTENNQNAENYSAFYFSSDDMKTTESLNNAIQNAKLNGFTAVVVPLKSEGGLLYYNSSAPLAIETKAVASQIPAADIAKMIKKENLIAIADINVLRDNIAGFNKDAGFTFEGTTSSWYDNSIEKGGKPWISPFSDKTKEYLTQIATEVSSAGFDTIICSDVIFPPFRNSDLNYIGQTVKDPNRYKALINILNIFSDKSKENKIPLSLELSAKGIIEGTAEVFKLGELPKVNIIADYKTEELKDKITDNGTETILSEMTTYDKVKTVFEKVKTKTGDMEIIPCIYQKDMDEGQLSEAKKALVDLGYKAYIIK